MPWLFICAGRIRYIQSTPHNSQLGCPGASCYCKSLQPVPAAVVTCAVCCTFCRLVASLRMLGCASKNDRWGHNCASPPNC